MIGQPPFGNTPNLQFPAGAKTRGPQWVKNFKFSQKSPPQYNTLEITFCKLHSDPIPSGDSNYIDVNREDPVISASDYFIVTLRDRMITDWPMRDDTYMQVTHLYSGEIIR